jgi:hypothetical protein
MISGVIVGDPLNIAGSPTAGYMNTTAWSTYSSIYTSYGLTPLIIITIMAVTLTAIIFLVATSKTKLKTRRE